MNYFTVVKNRKSSTVKQQATCITERQREIYRETEKQTETETDKMIYSNFIANLAKANQNVAEIQTKNHLNEAVTDCLHTER